MAGAQTRTINTQELKLEDGTLSISKFTTTTATVLTEIEVVADVPPELTAQEAHDLYTGATSEIVKAEDKVEKYIFDFPIKSQTVVSGDKFYYLAGQWQKESFISTTEESYWFDTQLTVTIFFIVTLIVSIKYLVIDKNIFKLFIIYLIALISVAIPILLGQPAKDWLMIVIIIYFLISLPLLCFNDYLKTWIVLFFLGLAPLSYSCALVSPTGINEALKYLFFVVVSILISYTSALTIDYFRQSKSDNNLSNN